MTTLITGGTGFLGAELAKLLIADGERPVLLDPAPPRGDLLNLNPDSFVYERSALGSLPRIIEIIRRHKVDIIVHLAGLLSVPCEEDHLAGLEVNVDGTRNVLEAARLEGVTQVLFSSSVAVYGLDIPDGPITDATLERPNSLYGATKVFGELLGRFYARRFGLDFRAVRIPSVVGPGSRIAHMSIYNCWAIEKPLKGQAYELLVEPETRCPTIYYKDVARALLLLGKAPRAGIKTMCYNLGGPSPSFSAGQLVEAVRARLPEADLTFKPDPEITTLMSDLGRLPLDDANARREWGWSPAYDLEDMVDDFIATYRANPAQFD